MEHPRPVKITDVLQAQPGRIMLQGDRFVLLRADALGLLRRDLITVLGRDRAKGFLLRHGWACGYHDARSIREQHPDCSDQSWIEQGPIWQALEGTVAVNFARFELNREEGTCDIEGTWVDSYETEQHLRHFGRSDEGACWMSIGYAGGYTSAVLGRQVIYKEVTCEARGDAHCRLVGRNVAQWGTEIEDELSYYTETKIGEELEAAHLNVQVADLARSNEDALLALTLDDYELDSQVSRDWSKALTAYALERTPEHRELLRNWVAKWSPLAYGAVTGLAPLLGQAPSPLDPVAAVAEVRSAHGSFLQEVGLA